MMRPGGWLYDWFWGHRWRYWLIAIAIIIAVLLLLSWPAFFGWSYSCSSVHAQIMQEKTVFGHHWCKAIHI